ncbi:thioester reductase domain-containing protein [Gordonia sinesedis]
MNPDPDVSAQVAKLTSIAEIIDALAAGYADRAALGWRDTNEPEWHTLTYRELADRVHTTAATLQRVTAIQPGDRVVTLGATTAAYAVASLATQTTGAVEVPLQTGASPQVWAQILDETAATVLAVSADYLDAAAAAITDYAPAALTHLVVFGVTPTSTQNLDTARQRLATNDIQLITLDADAPAGSPADAPDLADPTRLALLIYTSGSTGTPKGAMYTAEAVARQLKSGFGFDDYLNDHSPWVTLNFMPLSHVMGRVTLLQTLGNGGTAYFTQRADLSTLLDDLAAVQPTQLHFVPRIWEMLYQEFLRTSPSDDDALQRMREQYFGDRTAAALVGSAPISTEVRTFAERLLGLSLLDGYGSTEAGGVMADGHVQRPPVIDYKLDDVPELGYRITDSPYPRGELLVRTEHIFAGYYHRPDLTAQVFDDDGYYRTGDIVAETGPDELRYLDRRNNVLKLSQGEFVTVSAIEATLTAPPIRQIYVYGNSSRPYLLAVVVPTEQALHRHRADDAGLRREIQDALRDIGDRNDFAPYEIPRDFIIETTPFSLDNGLLTGIRKLARPQLKATYGPRLEDMYAQLADSRAEKLRQARSSAATRPTIDTLIDVVTALLDLTPDEVGPTSRFTDLGGDSLTAVTLGGTLEDIFHTPVPVGALTNPSADLAGIAAYMDRRDSDTRPTAASVHPDPTRIRATELTIDAFISDDDLREAATLDPASADVRTVFITGATGFLGRYLTLEWLRRLDGVDGATVICLVRATDNTTARSRLDAVFDSGDRGLWSDYQRLAASHLRVLAGDKDVERLGLDEETWADLAATVDLIVDPAALVNHVLPYRELFGPNVAGTAELIRFALTTTRKPYIYISTVAVGSQIPTGTFTEAADIRQISPSRELDDSYANGYANSKWAGEVLLRDANERYGLPATVIRCDMIVADDHSLGQLNLPDMFTRLLLSVLVTGIAPRSFYELAEDGSPQSSHYDALPVDFLAAAISSLYVGDGFVTYNAMNPHHDGIGLDEYITWLRESGEQIALVDSYDDWYRQFRTVLADLPEKQRRNSLIPLLHNYVHPMPPEDGALAPADEFRAAVRAAGLGPGGDIPHITPQIILNYARGLRARGLL